jgi:ribonuclease PH
MKRHDGRAPTALRKIRLLSSVLRQTYGSALIQAGETQVLCAASVEEKVPSFLRGSRQGWITAEYGMLPGSGFERVPRNRVSGRGMEIQRLIGRSLRSIADLTLLGERTITLDCDVLEADGGTRTAAITAAYVALHEAVSRLRREGKIEGNPLLDRVAAISVGRVEGHLLLDLCREEDSAAEVDFNLVATGSGRLVEVQGTAEHGTFSERDLQEMVRLGLRAIGDLTELQGKCLKAPARKPGLLLGAGTGRGREKA